MKLKKISCKLEKMTLYIVILTEFKFTGIKPVPATMVTELELLGTYRSILKSQKLVQPRSKFTI